MARRYAVGAAFEDVVSRYAGSTDAVIAAVAGGLPAGFATRMSDPIFDGVRRHARILRAG